jgi:hypothetical protein
MHFNFNPPSVSHQNPKINPNFTDTLLHSQIVWCNPNMFTKQKVITPYGAGTVSCIRDETTVIVVPCDWLMAAGQKPKYYLNPKDVKPFYDIDSDVMCSFGRGTVKLIRPADGMYVVLLNNWHLANGKSPTLYLNESSLSKPVEAQPESGSAEVNFTAKRLAMALDAKNAAADFFKKSEWYNARALYVESLNILQVHYLLLCSS